jgi:DNA-binding beta-propeller fold protein YncE
VRTKDCVCGFLAALLLLCSWATRADFIYSARGPLSVFDTYTGIQTLIGPTSPISHITGLAFSPNGTLYAVSNQDDPDSNGLSTIDLITGAGTLIGGNSAFLQETQAIAFDLSGRLYSLETGGQWNEIDPATGLTTFVGKVQFQGADLHFTEGLAVTPVPITTGQETFAAGTFFAFGNRNLYTIDPSTLVASLVNTLPIDFSFGGLTFGPTGTLYFPVTNGAMYSYDLKTQISTVLASDLQYGGVVAAFPTARIPEPATFTLMLAGLGILSFVARRRNKLQERAAV